MSQELSVGAASHPQVTASMLAVQNTEVGVARTLMALPPVFMLPVSRFYYRERLGWQAAVGPGW